MILFTSTAFIKGLQKAQLLKFRKHVRFNCKVNCLENIVAAVLLKYENDKQHSYCKKEELVISFCK